MLDLRKEAAHNNCHCNNVRTELFARCATDHSPKMSKGVEPDAVTEISR
jgi:hypothetical protein